MSRVLMFLGLLLAVLAGAVIWLQSGGRMPSTAPSQRVANLLGPGPESSEFERASTPGAIRLPEDHGAHPRFRSEWWYFTGNLADATGAEFGFQLTFFRYALFSEPVRRASDWATNQIYMAHFAITDREGQRHEVAERVARGALGLAGAEAVPFVAWLDDWRARSIGAKFLPLELTARDPGRGMWLRLTLDSGKPAVMQGQQGLSRKGPEPGNASYYYSYTRLPARGVIALAGTEYAVRGLAWLDREWSTSSLGRDLVGWDWFSLQLEDGRDLMLYSLRDRQGLSGPDSAGTLVADDGTWRPLGSADFRLRPAGYWRSKATGTRYPVQWEVLVPDAKLALVVRAIVPDQEQDLTVRYWEGAVDALDLSAGRRVGRGYMELTGY